MPTTVSVTHGRIGVRPAALWPVLLRILKYFSEALFWILETILHITGCILRMLGAWDAVQFQRLQLLVADSVARGRWLRPSSSSRSERSCRYGPTTTSRLSWGDSSADTASAAASLPPSCSVSWRHDCTIIRSHRYAKHQLPAIATRGTWPVCEWVSAWIYIAHNRWEPLMRWMH